MRLHQRHIDQRLIGMKRTAIIVWITSFFLVGMIPMALAQHDHSSHGSMSHSQMDAPPHGGTMKLVGKYHIEMTVNMLSAQDKLSFYLYKSNMKTVSNEGITGTVSFENEDGTKATQELRALGTNGFAAQLQNTNSFNCTVSFEIKGKTVSTYFTHKGLGHGATAIYTCSMHPDIQSDAPGNCPKCGMNLEKL